jgi:Mrp family chromosome partitioning ATPase
MSKNFELLQRVARGDIFNLPCVPTLPPQETPGALPLRNGPPDTEITKLVQRLFFQGGKGNGPSVVSFSGVARDDRSGWICARAGEALAAQVDTPVCIVEANLRSPQLHLHVNTGNQIGLAKALSTTFPIQSFATQPCGENLCLIPSGLVKPGLYTSMERSRKCFAELRQVFKYILISAPALTREIEATFVGQLADGIVLIVEANRNRRETVRRAKERLESAQVQMLGAVLDQRTFPIPEKIYRRL